MKDEIYASALQHVVGLGNASLGNLFTYYESAKEAWHHVLHHNVEPSLGCKYELFDEIREEHENYRRGGWSSNYHLFNAKFTVKNLYNFFKIKLFMC